MSLLKCMEHSLISFVCCVHGQGGRSNVTSTACFLMFVVSMDREEGKTGQTIAKTKKTNKQTKPITGELRPNREGGYLSFYALASYVVYSAPNGVTIPVQGGVYAVGATGQGGFYPTWVAT
ncbi:hypothetical protein ACQJBY_071856 [Aegilops geniculata]